MKEKVNIEKLIQDYNILDDGVDCKGNLYKKVNPSKRLEDISGKTYGRLTPIFVVMRPNYNHQHWLCLCECGKLSVVLPANLKKGYIKSCGCLRAKTSGKHCCQMNTDRKENLVGKKFGYLIVLEPDYEITDKHPHWKCLCQKCGRVESVRGDILKNENKICCKFCNNYYSRGEQIIKTLLDEASIPYIQNKGYFKDLRNPATNQLLRYDFIIFKEDKPLYLIEFDGSQHVRRCAFWDDENSFYQRQRRDDVKNAYAITHNLPLIRIPYSHYKKLTLCDIIPDTSSFVVNKISNIQEED